MSNEMIPGAWIVEATIAALATLLIGKACGIQVTFWMLIVAIAIGCLIVTGIRYLNSRHPPRN